MIPSLRILALLLLLANVTLSGCRSSSPAKPPQMLAVTVSIPPQQYFVQRIGGDRVQVNSLIEPGIDPHTYELTADKLRSLAQSQLYFSIGGNLEKNWLPRLQAIYPQLKIIDTSRGVKFLPLAAHNHEHSGQNEPDQDRLDPHIWLSPRRVKIQAENIYQALTQVDPANKSRYRANRDRFLQEINAFDQSLQKQLKSVKQKKFMVFHPEWGYFAHDYGLEMIAIEVEGNEPNGSDLVSLINTAKKENIHRIIVQPEFSQRSAEAIASEIQGQLYPISAFSTDWFGTLHKAADIFSQKGKSPQSSRQIPLKVAFSLP